MSHRGDDYNRRELEAGRITFDHIDRLISVQLPEVPEVPPAGLSFLVEEFQQLEGLAPDGKLGPMTRAALVPSSAFKPLRGLPELVIGPDHWIVAGTRGVIRAAMHPSWYLNAYRTDGPMTPEGWVDHFSVTGPGSAKNMAKRRKVPREPGEKKTGWTFTIETDGVIWQQAPANVQQAHAGHTWANEHTIGIEYVSRDGAYFTPEQVEAGARLCRALVRHYSIPRTNAGIPHSSLNPSHTDPGPVWAAEHRDRVIAYAYARDGD